MRQHTEMPQKSEHNQEEASLLAMLGAEACCRNNSSFRSHNHQSLRFLKLFLRHKDGGKRAGKPALNTTLSNYLLCHRIHTEKFLG